LEGGGRRTLDSFAAALLRRNQRERKEILSAPFFGRGGREDFLLTISRGKRKVLIFSHYVAK